MIELLIVIAFVGILAAMALFAAKLQIAKGRDARRKTDLAKFQKALEDYLNDEGCYPTTLDALTGYISEVPKDPINNTYYNYFYSYDERESCKSWYKIYARLEYTKDPIIKKVGCTNGCGPSGNYNYWVASPNMNKVEQTAGEFWWPEISEVTPSPTVTATPIPTLMPTPSLILSPTPTPTPTSPPPVTPTFTPTASPTPTSPSTCESNVWACFATGNPDNPGECRPFWPWPICNQWNCPSTYGTSDCGAGATGDPCDNPSNWCVQK